MDDSTSNPPLKRCSTCKEWKPATSEFFNKGSAGKTFQSQCKTCQRERQRVYRETCPDKILAKRQKHYQKNREVINAKSAQWRAENPELMKEISHQWYLKNIDYKKQYSRNWLKRNPERHRINSRNWVNLNPKKNRVKTAKYRSRKASLRNDFSKSDWDVALGYWDNKCAICGKSPDSSTSLAMDHWIPVVRGGATTSDNILPLCHAKKNGAGGCNNRKGAKDGQSFLIEQFGEEYGLQKLRDIEMYFAWAIEQRNRIK